MPPPPPPAPTAFSPADLCARPPSAQRGEPISTLHELELEVLSPTDFLTQGHYWTTGVPNSWEDSLECIVNTLRTLNRNAGEREGAV